MEYETAGRGGGARGCLAILGIFAAMLACTGIGLGVVDYTCVNEANIWMPYYPDAEVAREAYNVFRPFGVGQTLVELRTQDSEATVREWYSQIRTETPFNFSNVTSSMRWDVQTNDDGSTTVILFSECIWNNPMS